MNLPHIRDTAETIAREAGAVLMSFFDQPHQERTKSTLTDIVTEGDTASEAVIIPALLTHFPDHAIISEEGGGTSAEAADFCWYIDPLDGTSNYASNIPFFSVSIALADRALRPLVGVVFDPFTGQMFSAARGYGVTLNGRAIHVSEIGDIGQAMLCTGFPYNSAVNPDNNLREWAALTKQARGLRRFGSVALELGFVAAGRFDGLWEQRVNAWDVMAGILFVQEAGGLVTDYNGDDSELVYQGKQVIASNGHIHTALLEALQAARTEQG